jgi:hypothetical protein
VPEDETADPSATLGMTKVGLALQFGVVFGEENCRSLGYARDDKGEGGAATWHGWTKERLRCQLAGVGVDGFFPSPSYPAGLGALPPAASPAGAGRTVAGLTLAQALLNRRPSAIIGRSSR